MAKKATLLLLLLLFLMHWDGMRIQLKKKKTF